jgi:hypothetical protein
MERSPGVNGVCTNRPAIGRCRSARAHPREVGGPYRRGARTARRGGRAAARTLAASVPTRPAPSTGSGSAPCSPGSAIWTATGASARCGHISTRRRTRPERPSTVRNWTVRTGPTCRHGNHTSTCAPSTAWADRHPPTPRLRAKRCPRSAPMANSRPETIHLAQLDGSDPSTWRHEKHTCAYAPSAAAWAGRRGPPPARNSGDPWSLSIRPDKSLDITSGAFHSTTT